MASGIVNFESGSSVRSEELVAHSKIGIGTHTQTANVHCVADAPVVVVEDKVGNSTQSALRILADGGTTHLQSGVDLSSDSKGDFKFQSMLGATTHMTIDGTSSHVGIATASPQDNLHIYSNEAGGTQLKIENANTTGDTRAGLFLQTRSSNIFALQYTPSTETVLFDNKGQGGYTFYQQDSGGTTNQVMHITKDGNVGITTPNPTNKLHIQWNAGDSGELVKLTDSTRSLVMGVDSNHPWVGTSSAHDLRLITNNNSRIHIKSDGHVHLMGTNQLGIGYSGGALPSTTSPLNTQQWSSTDDTWEDMWHHKFDANWNLRMAQYHDVGTEVKFGIKQRYNTAEYTPLTFRGNRIGIYNELPNYCFEIGPNGNGTGARVKRPDGRNVGIRLEDQNLTALGGSTRAAGDQYQFIMSAPRPGTTENGLTMFINSENRTTDGGASCCTIRNDNGPMRFGGSGRNTTLTGYRIFTENRKFYPKNISSYYHRTGTINQWNQNYDLQYNVDFKREDDNTQTTVHEGYFLITAERTDSNPFERAMGYCYLQNGNFYSVVTLPSSNASLSFTTVAGSGNPSYTRLRVAGMGNATYPASYHIELIGIGGQAITEGTY